MLEIYYASTKICFECLITLSYGSIKIITFYMAVVKHYNLG